MMMMMMMMMTCLEGAETWITQFYLHTIPCLPVPRKHLPDGTTNDCGHIYLIAAYYSFIDPERMKYGTGLLKWKSAPSYSLIGLGSKRTLPSL